MQLYQKSSTIRLLYWGPWVMNGRLWRQTSLLMGTQLDNLEWARLVGAFERWLKGALEMERLSLWELCEVNLERGSSTGDFER